MGRYRRPRFRSRNDVVEWWTEFLDGMGPIERALTAAVFADPEMVGRNARLRREAIYLATRTMSHADAAVALDVGVPAIDRAIKLHNQTVRTMNDNNEEEVQP